MLTNYQLSLQNAAWIDANSRFTTDNLPDRLPNVLAVTNSLWNLFNCPIGARGKIFQPEYGSEWHKFLQEPIDDMTAATMRVSMFQSITRWEPRIALDYANTTIVAKPELPGYVITIAGVLIITNQPFKMQFREQL